MLESFTDYVVESASTLRSAIFTDDDPEHEVFLSSLRLEVKDIYYIYAPNLNVIDDATAIHVGRYFSDDDADNIAEANIQRAALQKAIEAIGGKVSSSISSKTNYLINNDISSMSTKNLEAKKLGIPIISEQEFIEKFLL